MPVKLEPRIEYAHEMLLIGIRQTHAFAVLATEIPLQWVAFKMAFEAARYSPVTYGVVCGVSENCMEYMCAVEVADWQSAPVHAGKLMQIGRAHV